MKPAELEVGTDEAFNIIGQVEASDPATHKKAVIGSHLDTVPNGGRFDKTLGVLAGLE
ncbi:hypothetical protein [Dethiosulfatarculus sandiegensis]|uniref:Uncharacterized protein n=1 Tax=Dethiosulfatarculus sandiegensis TaxID=1429043 RepID=A0A0D2GL11_9BACT|nr:hypothetical protein [Dethiosulfatarculus sandiegensis]KIX15412.1 hypothetical protein X474_03620 [Dethiosulfatarculus sandiegensis]